MYIQRRLFIATELSQPERSTITITSLSWDINPLQTFNLKHLEPVKNVPRTVAVTTPADKISFTDGRVGAALDTFRYFIEKPSEENLLNQASWGQYGIKQENTCYLLQIPNHI